MNFEKKKDGKCVSLSKIMETLNLILENISNKLI